MPYEWMLILITAVAPTEYNVASPFESLDECLSAVSVHRR